MGGGQVHLYHLLQEVQSTQDAYASKCTDRDPILKACKNALIRQMALHKLSKLQEAGMQGSKPH